MVGALGRFLSVGERAGRAGELRPQKDDGASCRRHFAEEKTRRAGPRLRPQGTGRPPDTAAAFAAGSDPPPPRPPGTTRKGPPGPTRPGPAGMGTGGDCPVSERGPSPAGLGSARKSPTRRPGAWAPVPGVPGAGVCVSRERGFRPGFSAHRWASSDVSCDVCLGGNKTPSRRPPSPD